MLAIPRPSTRAECRAAARPCPWIGCRYHLLIEVTSSGALQLNGGRTEGRPAALCSSAPSAVVEVWTDDALEQLEVMPHTCALDVAERGDLVAGVQPIALVARALLLTDRAARLAVEEARLSLPARWASYFGGHDD